MSQINRINKIYIFIIFEVRTCVSVYMHGCSTAPLERLFRSLFSRPLLKRDFCCILIRYRLLLIVTSVDTAYEVVVQFLWRSLGQNLMPCIIDRMVWKSPFTAHHYIKSNQVLHSGGRHFLVEKRFNECLQGI